MQWFPIKNIISIRDPAAGFSFGPTFHGSFHGFNIDDTVIKLELLDPARLQLLIPVGFSCFFFPSTARNSPVGELSTGLAESGHEDARSTSLEFQFLGSKKSEELVQVTLSN